LIEKKVPPTNYRSMDGNSSLVCEDGHWDKRIPVCKKTASKMDFSGNSRMLCFHANVSVT